MEKINLNDLTILIPLSIDNKERLQNLWMVLYYLNRNFNTNIIVGEQNNNLSKGICCEYPNVTHMQLDMEQKICYKTKLLNKMLKNVETDFVANYDCDVLFTIKQYILTMEALRNKKAEVVWPFDQPTAEIIRQYFDSIISTNNPDELPADAYMVFNQHLIAPGGAVFMKTKVYKQSGGENESFIAYGPEDREKQYRLRKLGYSLARVEGFLYHLNHPKSSNTYIHQYRSANDIEFERIKRMTTEQLSEEIKEWDWYKELNQ